jgi:hypothetical protein
VTGTATDLLALRRDSALNIDGLRAAVIIGLDDVLAEGDAEALQALLADVPADAMRIATLDNETPAVESFLEAYTRRCSLPRAWAASHGTGVQPGARNPA